MWIVKLALNRPYTFLVAALLILIVSPIVILSMPVDIFPAINIPVVSIIWSYTGFSPSQMEGRIVSITERALTTTVNDIEHIESQSPQRHRGGESLLSPEREDRHGGGADHGRPRRRSCASCRRARRRR